MRAGSLAAAAERWLVVLIALHTFAIGFALLAAPAWALRFGGWETVPPLFFPRQAGVFHLVVGAGYLVEYARHRTVFLLLTAKALATVFLTAAALAGGAPWFVGFAGAADGLMGLAVLVTRRLVRLAQPRPDPVRG
ncbi:MAG: hypothetical protein EPN53_08540 [Acidobacteria bacterium]|nr:MAG: hypothetical protein EPN53_08540 [Acidobacteriota bacterium]